MKKVKQILLYTASLILAIGSYATVDTALWNSLEVKGDKTLDDAIACVQNLNGDWVEARGTTTPEYTGKKRHAPCVFFEGKTLEERSYEKTLTGKLVDIANGAVNFNATSDEVDFGDTFDFTTSGTFSIVFDAKLSATAGCDGMLSKETNTAGIANWAIFTADCFDAGDVVWRIGGGNSAERTYCRWDHGGSALDDGEWHSFAITHNNGTTCAAVVAYVDGISRTITQVDTGSAAGDNTNAYQWGCLAFSCSQSFIGQLDDVRIFNYVIGATQAESMASIRGTDEPGLLGYWRTDEGALSTGADIFSIASHASSSNGTFTSVTFVDSSKSYPE